MSDSDCSNCDKECKYRDDSYDCEVNIIKEMHRIFTDKDINDIKKFLKRIKQIHLKGENSSVSSYLEDVLFSLRRIITTYKEKV